MDVDVDVVKGNRPVAMERPNPRCVGDSCDRGYWSKVFIVA